MKFPKIVNISGRPYSVKMDSSRWGGHITCGEDEIVVGAKRDQSDGRKFANYVHEVLEGVLMERELRFVAGDGEIVFVMNHKQFDDFANDFATALFPMIKK